MTGSREAFLRGAFARLHAASLPYCVSRNVADLYQSTTSDVDLVVLPDAKDRIERILTEEAAPHGYSLIARNEFTNRCLVYWAPGADFVRIDLDGELRWLVFEIADASTLLESAAPHDGVNLICPTREILVMADRLAWQGSLPAKYKRRVTELLHGQGSTPVSPESRLHGFLRREDATGLRLHLIRSALLNPHLGCRAMIHAVRDMVRMARRLLSPPGVFISVSAENDTIAWMELFRTMSMAFPESKCGRIGRFPWTGLLGLFRGGIVVAGHGHPVTDRICALFSSRRRRFRITTADTGRACDLAVPQGITSAVEFADILANALATRSPRAKAEEEPKIRRQISQN
jgi:hypothetical protein